MSVNENDHSPAFVCSHVFAGSHPVLLVCKVDEDWQFLCGGEHDEDECPHVVGLVHLLKRDSSLQSVLDLPEGWEAERDSVNAPWCRRRIDDE